mmetsp:Transcript_20460/g.34909  ORF Transcript_20460/g.34909 Transcript_20460/m.34909 type:complete len:464 (+) Transcript_20460:20-1411(+)
MEAADRIVNVDTTQTRSRTMKLGLTHWDGDDNVKDGFVLYSSIYPEDPNHNYVRILNMEGKQVHQWDMGTKRPGLWSYMPEPRCVSKYTTSSSGDKGFILAMTKLPENEIHEHHDFIAWMQDSGGCIQLIDWNGNIIWTYKDEYQHHDARLTREGNLVYIANEVLKNKKEAKEIINLAASHRGFPKKLPFYPSVYVDVIKMVNPVNGELLFEWHAAQHLDPQIDVLNYNDPLDEWNHGNTVVPLYENKNDSSKLTHLLVSFRQISTIVKIDVSNGNFERILKMPFVSQQHDCSSIEEGNTNRILVFDNRYIPNDFAPSAFSRVVEYDLTEKEPCPFLPLVMGPKIRWMYVDGVCDLFSAYISGAQRLSHFTLEKHGIQYTLITEGMKGRIFIVKTVIEKNPKETDTPRLLNSIIWEYMNPEIAPGDARKTVLGRSSIFRSRYYTQDYFSSSQLNEMKTPSSRL